MRTTRITRSLGVVAAAAGLLFSTAGSAQAASAPYGRYAYEGVYPGSTPCSGRYYLPSDVPGGATRSVSYAGRTVTLKYYYNGGCGSFARIENAPTDCEAYLDRSDDGGATWVNVSEQVESGLNYAYTKMGNNLNGRYSRAALVCGLGSTGVVLARTNWY
ncbi:hypothetical protein [Streptomyces sp. NPDC047928]|uniref:hypothetical protein n=1 Tax=unclassified Streptomyces TaxID=2593676 RepID=UPI00371C785F